jgi:hypothetical protein
MTSLEHASASDPHAAMKRELLRWRSEERTPEGRAAHRRERVANLRTELARARTGGERAQILRRLASAIRSWLAGG